MCNINKLILTFVAFLCFWRILVQLKNNLWHKFYSTMCHVKSFYHISCEFYRKPAVAVKVAFFFLLPTKMVTLQLLYRELSLSCSDAQINILCFYPNKGHKCSYTLLITKQAEINFANVVHLWGFSWDRLQARWLRFNPSDYGIFSLCYDVLSSFGVHSASLQQ